MMRAKIIFFCFLYELCVGADSAAQLGDVGAAEPYDIIDLHIEEGAARWPRRDERVDAQ